MPNDAVKRVSPARRVAFAGLVAALSCAVLYLAYVLPVLRFSALFVLSLLPVALAHERRFADALLSFAASALLSGLLFPAPGTWLLYVAFFGWYGILREFVIGKLGRVWRWVILAAAFNVALFALYFLAYGLFQNVKILNLAVSPVLLIPMAEVAFVVFELFFSVCTNYYASRIRNALFKR